MVQNRRERETKKIRLAADSQTVNDRQLLATTTIPHIPLPDVYYLPKENINICAFVKLTSSRSAHKFWGPMSGHYLPEATLILMPCRLLEIRRSTSSSLHLLVSSPLASTLYMRTDDITMDAILRRVTQHDTKR